MYSFITKIRYSECDDRSQLSCASLINYLQDSAALLCDQTGYGFAYLTKHQLAWFVLGWQAEVARMPRMHEDVCASIWLAQLRPTWARYGFALENGDGEVLIRASALYALVDTASGRALRIPQELTDVGTDASPHDLGPMRRKIAVTGEGTSLEPITVTKRHLDLNRHVNNGQYVQMADDVIRQLDPSFALSTLRVQYLRPAKLGDTIVPVLHEEEGRHTIELASPEGDTWAIVQASGTGEH